MSTKHPNLFRALSDGFLPSDFERGRTGSALLEDAIVHRFDDVLGPEGWRPEYSGVGPETTVCRITITLPDGSQLAKSGCGDPGFGNSHGVKTGDPGYLIAFRAAAALFGVRPVLLSAGQAPAPASNPEPPQSRHPGGFDWAHGEQPTNGHASSNGNGTATTTRPPRQGFSQLPANGKALYGKLRDMEKSNRERNGLVNHVAKWGKDQGYEGPITQWNPGEAAAGWAETVRIIQEVEGGAP